MLQGKDMEMEVYKVANKDLKSSERERIIVGTHDITWLQMHFCE